MRPGARGVLAAADQIHAAITYARRFAYMSVLGLVADDDDDGNQATRARQAEARKPPKTPADIARENLRKLVTANKLDPRKLGKRFLDDYGLDIRDADVETIQGFIGIVADEVSGHYDHVHITVA